MSRVFVAEETALDRKVVIKVLPLETAAHRAAAQVLAVLRPGDCMPDVRLADAAGCSSSCEAVTLQIATSLHLVCGLWSYELLDIAGRLRPRRAW